MNTRKVVITGASKGIGLAIAKQFACYGDEVLISSRNEANLHTASAEIKALNADASIHSFICDVSKQEQIKKLADFVLHSFGGCDVLVNNAGIFFPGSIYSEGEDNLEIMLQTNLNSAYQFTRLLVPSMMERKRGDIVNICSIASKAAYSNGGSYSISKFALLGFSKNLREEMKPFGVRVMSVLPGAVYTDSWSGVEIDEERLMPAEDIAQLVWTSCNLSRRSVVEELIVRPQLGDL